MGLQQHAATCCWPASPTFMCATCACVCVCAPPVPAPAPVCARHLSSHLQRAHHLCVGHQCGPNGPPMSTHPVCAVRVCGVPAVCAQLSSRCVHMCTASVSRPPCAPPLCAPPVRGPPMYPFRVCLQCVWCAYSVCSPVLSVCVQIVCTCHCALHPCATNACQLCAWCGVLTAGASHYADSRQ